MRYSISRVDVPIQLGLGERPVDGLPRSGTTKELDRLAFQFVNC
jgi:hypothetical protein